MYTKAEVSSAALYLECFISTLAIDASEEQHISIVDVAGAFSKADMEGYVIVKLQQPVVEALFKINEKKYDKYVTKMK